MSELVTERPEHRLKRLRMQSMRRGIKEMDIILTRYVDACLEALTPAQLDTYDALLFENDQDLYQWITGQKPAPEKFSNMIANISSLVGVSD